MPEEKMNGFQRIVLEILRTAEAAIVDDYIGEDGNIRPAAEENGYAFDDELGDEKSDQGEGLSTYCVTDAAGNTRLAVYINGIALELTAREISADEF